MLADVSKLPTGVPFKTIAQNAKNVMETITCKECEKPRLLYSPKKVRAEDLTCYRRAFQYVEYVCGSRIQNVDEKIAVYARENLNCRSLIEIPYYSVKEYPIVCVYCGSKNNLMERNDKFLPQCDRCDKVRINNRKRKSVMADDMKAAKKKKVQKGTKQKTL